MLFRSLRWSNHSSTRVARYAAYSSQASVEVEVKFAITDAIKKRIQERAKFISRKSFTDVYYDRARTSEYPMTTRDIWLRKRQGCWQLKVPIPFYQLSLSKGENKGLLLESYPTDQYKELENEIDILEFLKSNAFIADSPISELDSSLKLNEYSEILRLETDRRTFAWQDASIVFDDCLPLPYSVGEIEIMVADPTMISAAQ